MNEPLPSQNQPTDEHSTPSLSFGPEIQTAATEQQTEAAFPQSSLFIYVLVVCLICFLSAFTKGWLSFVLVPSLVVLVPSLVVLIPTLIIINAGAGRVERKTQSWLIRRLRVSQLIMTALAYVTVTGFGDTQEVRLLGLISADSNNPIVANLAYATQAIWIVAIVLFVALLLTLLFAKVLPKVTNKKHFFYGLFSIIIAGSIVGTAYLNYLSGTLKQADGSRCKYLETSGESSLVKSLANDNDETTAYSPTFCGNNAHGDSVSDKSPHGIYVAHRDATGKWTVVYTGSSRQVPEDIGQKYNLPRDWYDQ